MMYNMFHIPKGGLELQREACSVAGMLVERRRPEASGWVDVTGTGRRGSAEDWQQNKG